MKILKLQGPHQPGKKKIHKYTTPLGEVTEYRYRLSYGMSGLWFWPWEVLNGHYKNGDPDLLRVYEEIRELAKDHDVLYHMVGDMMHPDFIRSLSKRFGGPIFTIYNVDGEPASSEILSHPVVGAYDFALTCSKYFDAGTRCTDKLKDKGALEAQWVACGTKYPIKHEAWEIPIDAEKDIDVIFLGANMEYQTGSAPYPPNKYKAVEYLRAKNINVHCEAWQGEDHAAELYKRAKVGICLHGPSPYGVGNSQRLYDLAVCGVGIVTDGAGLGMNEIYGNDEVMSYLWSNFEEMYNQVKYLLDNPEVRILNAQRAREKTKLLYRNDVDDNWMLRGLNQAITYWKSQNLWTKK